jgi:hypothetical protein
VGLPRQSAGPTETYPHFTNKARQDLAEKKRLEDEETQRHFDELKRKSAEDRAAKGYFSDDSAYGDDCADDLEVEDDENRGLSSEEKLEDARNKLKTFRDRMKYLEGQVFVVLERSFDEYGDGYEGFSPPDSIHKSFDGAYQAMLRSAREHPTSEKAFRPRRSLRDKVSLDDYAEEQILRRSTFNNKVMICEFGQTQNSTGRVECMITFQNLEP